MKAKNLNYPLTDKLNMKVVTEMGNVAALIEEILKPILRPHKLGIYQFRVLEALFLEGDLRIGDLTEMAHTTGGNMTVVLRKLGKSGLIKRVVDPDDGRAFNISLSRKGATTIEKLYPEYLRQLEEKFSPLVRSEREQLGILLNKIAEPPVKETPRRKTTRRRKA